MPWEAWLLVAYLVLSYASLVARIGKPRTQAEVAFGVIDYAFVGWMVLRLADVL